MKARLFRHVFMLLVGLTMGIQAHAQNINPEDGWWWDPDASGRGYLLERQGDVMFLASFHYSDTGEPEWMTVVGTYTPADATSSDIGTLNGSVYYYTDGQCIACDYVKPIANVSTRDPATVTFHDNQNATLSWTGETVSISRTFWDFYNNLDQLYGQWALTTMRADADPQVMIVSIEGDQSSASIDGSSAAINDANGEQVGLITRLDDELFLTMDGLSEDLPLIVPETKRFYAGYRTLDAETVVALRIDDLPVGIATTTNSLTPDWTEATHSKNVDPNFTEVFDDTQVKRFDFVVTSERWQSMLDNMTSMYGEFGRSTPGGSTDAEDPIFVPAQVFYNGKQWYEVGIRFKGNSSLQSSWQQGILKLAFKLDFDEFEDDYPQIDNQRFYGFKKFSLKNNFDDESMLREKVSSDVFAAAGVPVSHTAFYTLYVDHGNGPEYFGLYTLVEEVDGPVIETQFSDDDGNLYKPEDYGASFIENSFDEAYFEKKTNEDEEDWSDILALFSALHDDSYNNNPSTWRAGMESVFDVDEFLNYLAVNQVIQNWDTYGRMPHNYYLYNNPENSKLTWIPWDNNEALQTGKQGGALNLGFSNIQSGSWPLIEKIYADDTYRAKYNDYVSQVINGPFQTSAIQATYDKYAALVKPYAEAERSGYSFLESTNDFTAAVSALKAHAASRATAVDSYLSGQ